MQVSDADARYRQCMYITDTYPISKGKLVHEIKMYESGMLELSLDTGSSRLNLGVSWSDKRDNLRIQGEKNGLYVQKGGPLGWIPWP